MYTDWLIRCDSLIIYELDTGEQVSCTHAQWICSRHHIQNSRNINAITNRNKMYT